MDDKKEVIHELPIEEARELYIIEFLISPIGGLGEPLKKENGSTATFTSKEEAEDALANFSPADASEYQVIERRHLKPQPEPDNSVTQ